MGDSPPLLSIHAEDVSAQYGGAVCVCGDSQASRRRGLLGNGLDVLYPLAVWVADYQKGSNAVRICKGTGSGTGMPTISGV